MNEPMRKVNRRKILQWTSGTAASMVALATLGRSAEEVCALTPRQAEGPFYPDRDRFDEDADLTHVDGRRGHALGQVVFVEGVVHDEECLPLAGVLVEIWQASANGRYDHRGDAGNPAPLDPNFQYWGQALSDDEGRYRFKTIIPGHYNADTDWIRPPHIHFKVSKRGYHELITQMYFAGNQYNAGDLILGKLSRAEQALVVIDFEAERTPEGIPVGRFNLGLSKVRP